MSAVVTCLLRSAVLPALHQHPGLGSWLSGRITRSTTFCSGASSSSMKFLSTSTPPLSQAALVYRPLEYSFAVEPNRENGLASILLDDLHLEMDLTGHLLHPWGLCPHTKW